MCLNDSGINGNAEDVIKRRTVRFRALRLLNKTVFHEIAEGMQDVPSVKQR